MSWHLHPDVIAWIALIQFGYLYALRKIGEPRGLQASGRQIALFTAGVAVLYIGAGTPIHDLAEQRLFSIHMVQHMLFTLIAPPLLLLGLPAWLFEPLVRSPRWFKVARALTRAFPAFILFNVITFATHLPPSVDATLEHHWLHFLVHVALILSATLMWWPILSPVRELPRLSPPLQMVYLFLQSLVPTVLASFITFSSQPLYHFYTTVPRTWGMSVVIDQRVAGLIMKIAGSAILWFVISVVFFRWVAGEERQPAASALEWDDVEQELTRMGLTKPGAPGRR
jgi:putative membrane protein